ncbi:MAG: MarR family winged helix-turn-helix transcriptional regulator [Streptosporangiaceae bacterium]
MKEHEHRWHDGWGHRPVEEWPLGQLFGAASRSVGMYAWRTSEQLGLSVSAWGVLMLLDGEDGLKSSELAERVWISAATVTTLVDGLERDGHVARRRDDGDRRVVRVYLTDEGRKVLAETREAMVERWRAAFDYIDPADEPVIRRFLLATIQRFRALAEEERT